MAANIWATVGTVVGYIPVSSLIGAAGQLFGMDPTGTFAEWKAATFLSNQLAVPVGGVGAPSYTFTGSLTTGFYSPAANQIGLSVAGAALLNVNANRFLFSKPIQMSASLFQEDQGADIPAAATTDLGSATGNFLNITNAAGATVCTSLGGATLPAGTEIETVISITGGSLSFTHNAVSLICLGAANVAAQDKDIIRWRKINDASAFWMMVSLQRGVNSGALTTAGDLLVGLGSGVTGRLGVGADGMNLFASSDPAEKMLWLPQATGFNIVNGYLDYTVAANALTIALKGWNGADPSASNPVFILFRDPTATTGLPLVRKIIAATSIVISSGSTLGTRNGIPFRVWVVAFDDAGTVRLAAINCVTTVANPGSGSDVTQIFGLQGWSLASSTAEGGAGAADSASVFYTGTAVAAKAYTVLGYATWEAGQAAAGTWATAASRKHLWQIGTALPGMLIQLQRNDTGAVATGGTVTPNDDTIPQITEGNEYMTQAITPSSTANILAIQAMAMAAINANDQVTIALHQDAIANALRANATVIAAAGYKMQHQISARQLAGLSVATTFRIRMGQTAANTVTFNGSAAARFFGNVANSFLEVQELMG